MRMDALGIKQLVGGQLKEVTWTCSNTHMSMDAIGINILVLWQLKEVTWKCSNTQ